MLQNFVENCGFQNFEVLFTKILPSQAIPTTHRNIQHNRFNELIDNIGLTILSVEI